MLQLLVNKRFHCMDLQAWTGVCYWLSWSFLLFFSIPCWVTTLKYFTVLISVSCYVTLCSLIESYWHFRGMYRLHLHGRSIWLTVEKSGSDIGKEERGQDGPNGLVDPEDGCSSSCKMLMLSHQTMKHHIPEDRDLHNRNCENSNLAFHNLHSYQFFSKYIQLFQKFVIYVLIVCWVIKEISQILLP